ncbi:MAG: hypothetical protein ABID38_04630 [Candidatus Diapherotrites archaeon]
MISMNQKGQEFSVFKLLIAAIVAVAILVVLLSIIKPPIPGQDPSQKIIENLKSIIDSPGTPKKIDSVKFQTDTTIVSKTLAEATDTLGASQVCLVVGETATNKERFDVVTKGKVIRYSGNLEQSEGILLLCSRANELNEDLEDLDIDSVLDTSECSSEFINIIDRGTSERVCIIGIVAESV